MRLYIALTHPILRIKLRKLKDKDILTIPCYKIQLLQL